MVQIITLRILLLGHFGSNHCGHIMQQEPRIRKYKSGNTHLHVFKDLHDKYKTVVGRFEQLESKILYEGYDKNEAIKVYNECLERFDIDEVDSVEDIEWPQ